MKTTVIFFAILALTSMTNAQKAFDQVKNLLVNFKQEIVDEQKQADIRHEKDVKVCNEQIASAEAKVASRQQDVDDLTKHIEYLENEKKQSQIDKKTREERLVANAKLIAKFKEQRCDNNLLFVKQLREHMEAIDVMTLLRGDILNYFQNKTHTVNTAFIERFSEFSHLLSEKHKQVFVQLTQDIQNLPDVANLSNQVKTDTSVTERTKAEIGTGYIDNNRSALKELKTPGYETVDVYNAKLEKRVIEMIDGLIQHITESREILTKREIKAAEDFAVFEANMEKENVHLKAKIVELTAHINDLTNQLNVANVQLQKREKLLQAAKDALAEVHKICNAQAAYYKSETARRNHELSIVDNAASIFNNILAKLSKRVMDRASELATGKKLTDNLKANVIADKKSIKSEIATEDKERKKVVF